MATQLIILLLAFSLANGRKNCGGWKDAAKWGDFCYKHVGSPLGIRWSEAENYCQSIGGHLVSIHSEDENNFIHSFKITSWIGLNYTAEASTWMDGTPVDYQYWYYPDGYGVAYILVSDGVWDTTSDDDTWFNYICKKLESAPLPTPSTSTSTTTTTSTSSPAAITGCSDFARGDCEEDDENILMETVEDSPEDCQEICSSRFRGNCNSFAFNSLNGFCTIKSSFVQSVDTCHTIAGPDSPPIDTCKKIGCQDFYRSDCQDHDLSPIKTVKDVDDPAKCQEISNQSSGSAQWILDGTVCYLYQNVAKCNILNGPVSPQIKHCL